MTRQIFRETALERLASPDQLDQAMWVVRPAGVLVAAVLGAVLAAALAWAAVAEVPVRVSAHGILVGSGGVLEVVSDASGRVEALAVGPGDPVTTGQALARLAQPELERELAAARDRLAALEARARRIAAFHDRGREQEERAVAARQAGFDETTATLRHQLALFEEKERGLVSLADRGVVTRDRLLEARLEVGRLRERLATMADERNAHTLTVMQRQADRERERLQAELEVMDARQTVDRLDRRLEDSTTVTSPYDGYVTEVLVNPGELAEVGRALLTLTPVRLDAGEPLTAILYVGPAEGKRVAPGMAVRVSPSTVKPQEYGYILGTVDSVGALPATREGMRRVLKNDRLVELLTDGGTPFEVRVTLQADPAAPSGYRWTSDPGPPRPVRGGTLADARITVDRVPVLGLALPGWRTERAEAGGNG